MGHLFISERAHNAIRRHKKKTGLQQDPATEDLIFKGESFQKLCEQAKAISVNQNKTPESVVNEIFQSALEYKKFLEKDLPVKVN
jgi:hypothetical protein